MSIIQGTSKAAGGAGYEIDQSIRFDKTTSSHLSKTYGSAGNRRTWTFSTWFKRGKIDGTRQILFAATGQAYLQIGPDAASREMITILNEGSGTNLNWYTTAVYRDPSAWYHLVWQFDSTQATADDRTKLYINGSQVTDFTKAATPSLNLEGAISNAVEHKIGEGHTAANYFDGYQAEINFIDGTALDATSFGETNDDGVWVPKAYTGSATGNSFYITGEDSADLGADYSGNSNDFTSSGLATTDQMSDTPTNNFCTLNAVDKATQVVLADGNLQYDTSGGTYTAVRGTFGVSSGKWYWEMSTLSGFSSSTCYIGIATNASNLQVAASPRDGTSYTYLSSSGNKTYTSNIAYGDTWNTNGRVIGVALDLDAGKIWWSRDGVWQASGDPAAGTNEAFSGITGTWHPYVVLNNASPKTLFNFGQTAFTYTPPTGFNALSTANLPTPSITDGSAHFQPTLYEGNGSTQSINQTGNSTFQPDFAWIKNRDATDAHALFDVVRGATEVISSNASTAEVTNDDTLTGFESDGFALGDDVIVNTNSESYVAWQWLANGAGSSNTDGSITSTVSANTTSGFSIIRWSGTLANGTIGHGLGIQPSLYIVKNTTTTRNWLVGSTLYSNTLYLLLNTTDALNTSAAVWNSAYPTSSVINLGSNVTSNGSGTNNMICYAFAEIPGYSSIGSYTGNGSADGTMIYTGFKPAFVIMKKTSGANNWIMYDATRDPDNFVNKRIYPNLSNKEDPHASNDHVDFLSNGFKQRSAGTVINASGASYIYMAFAEHPFGGDGVAPATAR